MREIYYGMGDSDRRALWKVMMSAYYHKMSEEEIMDFLVYHKGYSKEEARELMNEIKEEWLLFGLIKVKEK